MNPQTRANRGPQAGGGSPATTFPMTTPDQPLLATEAAAFLREHHWHLWFALRAEIRRTATLDYFDRRSSLRNQAHVLIDLHRLRKRFGLCP